MAREKRSILSYFPYEAPRPQQAEALLALEKYWDKYDIFVIVAPTACHGKGERVLLYNGQSCAVEDVRVGDVLIGPDSLPRVVLNCTSGIDSLYKVSEKRECGNNFIFTGNHTLSLRTYVESTRRSDRDSGNRWSIRYENVTINDWLKLSKTGKHVRKLWKPESVQFQPDNTKEIIPPYILGAWLGDGSSASPALTTMDSEMEAAWREFGSHFGLTQVRKDGREGSKASTYHLSVKKGHSNPITSELRTMGVYNHKHIPERYIRKSYSERMELLAGLMDTDGNFNPDKNSAEITQKSLELTKDILKLVRSLGFSGQYSLKPVNGTPYYRITFSGKHLTEIPLRIQRKRIAVNTKRDMKYSAFTVESIGSGEYFGFTVTGDSLYLMEDFTVTHNCGKSALSKTIAAWRFNSAIITPTNLLVQQYSDEFPGIGKLFKRELYRCPRFANGELSCETANRKYGRKKMGCNLDCEYLTDNRRARGRGYFVCNYYTYMANKLFKPTLIIDESHNIIKVVQDMSGQKLWRHDWHYPWDMWTHGDILNWVESRDDRPEVLQGLHDEITSQAPRYIIKRGYEMWNVTNPPEERELLSMLPVDVRDAPPYLWPNQVGKIVLLSATISYKDIESLGLDRRRTLYLEVDSPIPSSNRPIITDFVATVNRSNLKEATITMANRIVSDYLPRYEGKKGVIHATYAQAKLFREMFAGNVRFMFHDRSNTRAQYQAFLDAPVESGMVFVASGLYEGIDLAEDLGRWQIITKVPWLSLGDPAIKYKSELDSGWYLWQTLKTVCQACGRICRTPTDQGDTIVMDGSFDRLVKQSDSYGLIPSWWREALPDQYKGEIK